MTRHVKSVLMLRSASAGGMIIPVKMRTGIGHAIV